MLAKTRVKTSKRVLRSVFFKEIHESQRDKMHIFIVKMDNIFIRIAQCGHAHGAFLTETNTVSKALPDECDIWAILMDGEESTF